MNDLCIKYHISSNTVLCNWIKKYNQFGIEGLMERRGKPKLEELMTEDEKSKDKYKLLEAQNRRLQMENALLKKIQEIERRRY
ncbi:helix-turn-helix domain-containing protein [Clostridium estertheticum]|uniref:helix-turn-helix domain-containing protein n=1 Tax=Clostridium estertheticum TaxID=238834 RepID=UPI001C0D83C8|nr:helix-turn-helix domain-containing protein [Clostridium estertheticum]MBU3075739.1 helix-turn-helix domain-containing protein [Clostridium estertheticum]MBU3165851.1 helix-turn-helix domain-containing protein [Clostridium estertheticum]